MKKKIWLSSPHMGGTEQKYIQQAFEENWIAPLGPNVNGFEKELSDFLNIENVAALSSGTAGIHLALILLNVQRGDEVLCSSFTFSASANPIVYQGAVPVFIDSEKDTWNMDPQLLEDAIIERIKKGKKPKALIMVHLYGMPAKIDDILKIAGKYEIPVIEDAAESLGSKYKNIYTGTFGDFGIFSFNGNKIITTSGGGALVSKDASKINKSRYLATQARDNAPHYQHSEIGYNYRMSNICAGIGRGQLEVINERIKQRRENFLFYKQILDSNEGISFVEEDPVSYSNRWLTTILVDSEKTGRISREDIRIEFEKENIETRPLWKPMHLQPIFKDYPAYINGISEGFFNIGLCLPSGSNLNAEDKIRISELFNKILN